MNHRQISLNAGEDLLTSIHKFASDNGIKGFILGSIGDLSVARFKCPGNEEPITVSDHLELISLTGTFSPEKLHLHLSVSNNSCQVFGGHLEIGSKVLKQVDILLGDLTDLSINTNKTKEMAIQNQKIRCSVMILPNCPWSTRTIRTLASREIPYNVIEITDDNLFQQAKSQSGSTLFPQIYIDNKFIGGYEEFSKMLISGGLDFLKNDI